MQTVFLQYSRSFGIPFDVELHNGHFVQFRCGHLSQIHRCTKGVYRTAIMFFAGIHIFTRDRTILYCKEGF